MKPFGYIYLTRNTINNMYYVGQRKLPKGREIDKDGYIGSGSYFINAVKKYGKENFVKSILVVCSSQEELNKYEDFYINKFKADKSPNFYNISNKASGGNKLSGLSEEDYEKRNEKIRKSSIEKWEDEELRKRMIKNMIISANNNRENRVKAGKKAWKALNEKYDKLPFQEATKKKVISILNGVITEYDSRVSFIRDLNISKSVYKATVKNSNK
jgi:group I intron endonuclease